MRHLCTFALLLAAGQAAALDQGVNYTLSKDPNSNGTKVDYVITNEWTSAAGMQMNTPNLAAWYQLTAGVSQSLSVPNAGVPGWSGSLSSSPEFFAVTTSLTAHNVETNATKGVSGFILQSFTFNGTNYISLGLTFGSGALIDPGPPPVFDGLGMSSGQHVRISGDTTGSFVINKSFGFFNQGQWTYSTYGNVIIGSAPAVPEPSAYGLALGGLALAVVAARRRKASK